MLALALEGGGAKGAFHMGAVKALLEQGYTFDAVAGTSIGALNGAIIAQGDFEIGYHWWETLHTSLLFDIDQTYLQKFTNKEIDRETLSYLVSKVKSVIENRGLNTKKIRDMLHTVIDEEKLRQSKTDFGIVTVSVSDLKPLELFKEDIPKGLMVDYLMASANFPAFRIEPIDGKYYLDGGFYDNCPINLLARKGYKDIIAIRTFGLGRIRKVEDPSVNVRYILPSEELAGVLSFNNELLRTNMKMGYCDAMRVLKELKGRRYYITSDMGDAAVFDTLMAMPDSAIKKVGAEMGLPDMAPKRMLFERILPGLARAMDLPSSASYQDIIIGILEQMAENRGVTRYEVRTLSQFLSDIQSADAPVKEDDQGLIRGLAQSIRRPPWRIKKALVHKTGEEFIKILPQAALNEE
jgi:NTE family protein